MNRKGISAVVATVLVILLCVAGVGIVWLGVVTVIGDIDIDQSAGLRLVSSDGYTLWDANSRLATVQIERAGNSPDIYGIDIVFSFSGDSVTHFVEEVPGVNGKKVYYVNLSEYSGELDSIRIVPIFWGGVAGGVASELKIERIPEVDLVEMIEEDIIVAEEFVEPTGYSGGGGGSGGSSSGGDNEETSTCNNNVIESGETCDGVSLNLQNCSSQGFGLGNLTCLDDCSGYNVSGCVSCTDTCSSLGYECGFQDVCGVSTDCDSCSGEDSCFSGTCISGGVNITADINASRTSCVAPCGVFFDGTGSTGLLDGDYVNAFFDWDFDDISSGHNAAEGFVAAHVFETPGTYDVQMRVQDSDGDIGLVTETITVSSFSGTTYCVSASGAVDCPNGTVGLTDLDGVLSELGTSDRKFLFRRGETFNLNTRIDMGDVSNLEFGAYGSGAKPRIVPQAGVTEGAFYPGSNTVDVRLVDLDFDGEGIGGGLEGLKVRSSNVGEILYLRSDLHNLHRGVDVLDNDLPIYFVDSALYDMTYNHDIYYVGKYLVLLNNTITLSNPDDATHNMYIASLYKGVISDNILGGAPRSDILRLSGEATRGRSGDVVISNNNFYSTNNVYIMLHLGLNSGNSAECGTCDKRIDNVLVEKNTFGGDPGNWQVHIGGGYTNLTLRNNIFENGADVNSLIIDDANSRHESNPYSLGGRASQNINIFHNTFSTDTDEPIIQISNWANLGEVFDGQTETWDSLLGEPRNHKNINIMNNIFYSEVSSSFEAIGVEAQGSEPTNILDEVTLSNNLFYLPNNLLWGSIVTDKDLNKINEDPLFVGASDFHLTAPSPAINNGSSVAIFYDFDGNSRADGGFDIGAFEYV